MGSFRKLKIESLIRRVVSETIAFRLEDPRIEPLATTITRVEVSRDKQHANIYVHVRGNDAALRRTLSALSHARGLLQRTVAKQINVRHCPALCFEEDVAAKRAQATNELLAYNRLQYPHLFEDNDEIEEDSISHSPESTDTGDCSEDPEK